MAEVGEAAAVGDTNRAYIAVSNDTRLDSSQPETCSTVVGRRLAVKAHSQTIPTRQPLSAKRCADLASRAMLSANLVRQKSGRVEGVAANRHLGCLCQKQPWTNATAPNFGKTRSGFPGNSLTLSRYRNPLACRALRSRSSGAVFRPFIPAIIRDRVAESTISAKNNCPSVLCSAW